MTDRRSRFAIGTSGLQHHHLRVWALGLLLIPLLAGCGGREDRTVPEDTAIASDAAEATPEYNRDMHVIQELWKELKALEQTADSSTEKKRQALQQALQARVDALDVSADSLGESERQVLAEIKRTISRDKP